MSRRDLFPVLRTAAHLRHAAVVAAAWWWCPPVMMHRLADHADIVDEFYDELSSIDKEETE